MILLRLAPRDCWLVVALGQSERRHGQSDALRFCFCCSMRDALARKRFLINLLAIFWRKGAPTLDLDKYCLYLFLHEYKTRPLDYVQYMVEYPVDVLGY
jgi:hypothetical protein